MKILLLVALVMFAGGCSSTSSHRGFTPPIADLTPIPALESGLVTPVWVAAVDDSFTQLTVITNRFAESGYPNSFPVDSVIVRRIVAMGDRSRGEEMRVQSGSAAMRVRRDGVLESPDIRLVRGFLQGRGDRPPMVGLGDLKTDAHYYRLSEGGRFLAAIQRTARAVDTLGESGDFGLLQFFEVSNDDRPRRIGPTWKCDGRLNNVAVSSDGTLIAVVTAQDMNRSSVIVLRREGKRLTHAQRLHAPTTSYGLQFAGKFLVVGMEEPPTYHLSVGYTDSIAVFDLSDSAR